MWFPPVGNSFPSGHAVHFWSLFFPPGRVVSRGIGNNSPFYLFWFPWLEFVVNDHYFSDVVASAAVAALVTWAYAKTILARGRAVHTSLNEND